MNYRSTRFRPRRNFRTRYPGPTKQMDQDLLWAISSGKGENSQPTVQSHVEFNPKNRFESFDICAELKRNIEAKQYKLPTPIQDEAIPVILNGSDVIGIANTGTGKTAAFLIPLINKISKNRREKVLIVTPTRELALQIHEELIGFARGLNIYGVLCIGGANINRQKSELRRDYNFVIGTPGRLKDLYNSRSLDFYNFESVVLDEADRMVDIGFIAEIKYMISLLPKVRQSLFF